MKKIIIIIAVISISSCTGVSDNNGVIDGKRYISEFWGRPYPQGICKISYGDYYIEDSCHKYEIGDTIKNAKLLNH